MITIKKTSREFTPVEKYLMTASSDITSMKNVADGEKITVDGYLTFDDLKEKTGEVVEVMSIITPGKKVFSCQSATFKCSISDIHSVVETTPFTVIKISGKTKAGRDFINCVLDVDSI
jgi:hypothetical protein